MGQLNMRFGNILRFLSSENSENNPDFVELLSGLLQKFNRYNLTNQLAVANPDEINEIVNWANDQGYLHKLGLDKEIARMLANSIVVEHNLPYSFLDNPKVQNLIKIAIINAFENEVADRMPVNEGEADRIVQILLTGEVFSDIAFTLMQIITLGSIPWSIRHRWTDFFDVLVDLPVAIVADIEPLALIGIFVDQLVNIANGEPPKNPQVLNNTLKTIYSLPLASDVIKTSNALLDDRNETIRIVLIIYARLHHINLDQKAIDKIRTTILDAENPKLGEFLLYIIERAPEMMQ